MASPLKLTNNAIGRLTAGMSAVDTTATLVSGNGALFPTLGVGEFFPATIIRASDSAREIVKVTARSTDVLTVARAQEGTSALVFIAGDRVELRLTAGALSTEFARLETAIDAAEAAGVIATAAVQADADAAAAAAAAAQADADAAQATANAALPKAGGTLTGNLTMGAGRVIVFEGTTDDAHETTLTSGEPTADRVLTLPNQTGTLATTADADAARDAARPVLMAVQATTSGAFKDFAIPSWAKRITVMFNGVSTTGTTDGIIQLCVGAAPEVTGYTGSASRHGGASNFNIGFSSGFITDAGYANAGNNRHGSFVIELQDPATNTWLFRGLMHGSSATQVTSSVGSKSIAGALDAIRITTTGGVETYDAGSVSVMYE